MSIQQGGILIYSEDLQVLGELLTIGRELAIQAGTSLTAIVTGKDAQAWADDAQARGADAIVLVNTNVSEATSTAALSTVLYQTTLAVAPAVLLVGGTRIGLEIAAQAAQRLGVSCASDCMSLQIDGDGNLQVERRVYGGRFVARQVVSGTPRIATVQTRRFARAELGNGQAAMDIMEIEVSLPTPRVQVVNVSPRSQSQVDITKAEVLIAAGRGIKRVEDLEMLEKLAAVLGGMMAGSRPLTGDMDWLPVDLRVGLSGQTVKPNLYVACGISGQIEHIVGMKGARTVVVINNDPNAPIHAEADYSLIGDLYEIVPELVAACEQARANGLS